MDNPTINTPGRMAQLPAESRPSKGPCISVWGYHPPLLVVIPALAQTETHTKA
jgi:hypothetical protein